MAALPTGSGYNTRGTIGTAHDNTTVRVDYERMIGAVIKDLRFFQPKFMVQKKIPRKNNEVVRFSFMERATGAVYQLDEHGKQTAGTNSTGGAQTAGADVPTITLGMRTKTATIKRYGSVFLWTAIDEMVSERDIRAWGINEQGLIVAEQMDKLTKGLFDAYAQDLYPDSTITTDDDQQFLSTHVFNHAFLVKIRAYLKSQALEPPEGQTNFPMILPYDALSTLIMDDKFRVTLERTAQRRDPVATPFDTLFIGSLAGFDFYESNRILPTSTTTQVAANTFNISRAYVFTKDAVGCLSMEDPDYGVLPNDSGNNRSPEAARAVEETMPRPVATIFHDYGSGALGADPFKDHAGVVEKHTVGLTILNVGSLIRCTFAVGDAGRIGVAVATSGSVGHAGLDGSV